MRKTVAFSAIALTMVAISGGTAYAVNTGLNGVTSGYLSDTFNNNWGKAYIDAKNTSSTQVNGVNQLTPPTPTPTPKPASSGIPSISGDGYRSMVKDMQLAAMQKTPTKQDTPIVVGKTGTSTINVDVSTLKPTTMVMTDKGIVTAQSLPKNTQVSVPYDSAFHRYAYHSNTHRSDASHGEHGTGNGANNAAATHSAHGLGGGEHVSGGRSGGGFHY